MSNDELHFIHVADSHVASRDNRAADLGRLARAVDRVCRLHASGVPLDFVVHGGDLVHDADRPGATPATTRAALAVLDALPVRWYLLNGNHDRRAWLTADARDADGKRPVGCGEVPTTDALGIATRRIGPIRLVFVDANPDDGERDLDGCLSAETIAAIADHVDRADARSALFLHYPPLAQEAHWSHPPSGGEALHAALAARAHRLHGVFVAHNHRSLNHLRDGVLYVTAPSLSRQFLLWSGQPIHAVDENGVAGLHYVTLGADGSTRVQHHALPPGTTTSA